METKRPTLAPESDFTLSSLYQLEVAETPTGTGTGWLVGTEINRTPGHGCTSW